MRPSSRRIHAVEAGLAILVAAGCSGGGPSAPASPPIVASEVRESIRVTLALEGPPRTSAVSWASVRIENVGDRAIRWAGGGCGDPGAIFIDLGDVFPTGRADWADPLSRFKLAALGPGNGNGHGLLTVGYTAESRWGRDVACPASLSIETLEAGAQLSMRAGWDGTYHGSPVPTGRTKVEAVFPIIGVKGVVPDDAYEAHAVGASVRTMIVGSSDHPVLAPGLLIDAALADPEFAAWVSAGPVSRWINPDIAHIGDTWQVGLFKTVDGATSESYRGVVIDASGRVVGHKSG